MNRRITASSNTIMNRRRILAAIPLTLATLVSHPTTAAAKPNKIGSVYVDLKKPCKKIDGPSSEDDFQDWGVFRCGKRVGGWQLIIRYGDLREDVVLERKGVETSWDLIQFHGGFPASDRSLSSGQKTAFHMPV
jgi:hypothetical protein